MQSEACFTNADQYAPILSKYPEVEEEIISVLKKQRAVDQPLYGTTIQPLIKAIIQKRVTHLLDSTQKKGFKVSINWTRTFIKKSLNWSYRASTSVVGKLPTYWKEQSKMMLQRVAYLSKLHDIPPSLVVNSNQIGIHLVPTRGAKTWEKMVQSMFVCMAKRIKDKLLQLYHLHPKESYSHSKLYLLAKLSGFYLDPMKDAAFVKDLMGSNNKHQSLVNFTNMQGLCGENLTTLYNCTSKNSRFTKGTTTHMVD